MSGWKGNDKKTELRGSIKENFTETRFRPQCHRKGPCFLKQKLNVKSHLHYLK